ncbi:MAG: FGGY family carbohydrate kinase [Spirosomataceae bacterium]
MLLLGLDIGTSSVKACVVDAQTQQVVASAQYPDTEAAIVAPQPGWAEQDPESWWEYAQKAILRVHASGKYNPKDIEAIGIAYQMHGLVLVDAEQQSIRNSIIWCDSRAVGIGEEAFEAIGPEICLAHLLNSPGNFTASKLAWVMENEPANYEKATKLMLPGDFISMKLTGEITTSNSSLSEGMFWDFQANEVSADIMEYFGFEHSLVPTINPVFGSHGEVTGNIAEILGLKKGIPVTYKAGDQPNNALSLNVLEPGEVAATAGTSGVVYAVSEQVTYDPQSRVNTFAHVNHQFEPQLNRLGILLCINGTGILNSWTKANLGKNLSYPEMNQLADQVPVGSAGLRILPFGNGAERMLGNKSVGAQALHLDFNQHSQAHWFRAAQEGIACSFRYGMEIMSGMGATPSVIRAGRANLFLSELFGQTLVNLTQTPVELYDTDGAKGAALGAGIGLGIFRKPQDAFSKLRKLGVIEPQVSDSEAYETLYQSWKSELNRFLA